MTLIFHPRVRNDLREVLDYYDKTSNTVADRFFAEFEAAVSLIKQSPYRFNPLDELRRRCNLRRFPYHLIYEVHEQEIRVTVLRHHKRHPSYGLIRKWC